VDAVPDEPGAISHDGERGKRTSRTVGLSPGAVADLKMWQTLLLNTGPGAMSGV
jgi:hypothetical protein